MDDSTLKAIIENEKEWRTYMVGSIEDIRKSSIINSKAIIKLKTWNIVWRFIGGGFFTFLLYMLRSNIK